MTKNGSSARRRSARILARVDGLRHPIALDKLNGQYGDAASQQATALVQIVEAAVRARRAAVGGSQSVALEKVLQGNTNELPDDLFSVLSEPAERWQLLSGVNVTLDRHSPDFSQYLTGVVLGFEWRESSPALRVVLTTPALGKPAGQVVTIEAQRWRITPSPTVIASTASRDTHCEAGRPLYSEAELAPHVLATLQTLNLMRLRPSLLQAPVASLRDSSNTPPALYAIADAEAIPTAPRNAAANARRRTCVTCGDTSATPFPATADGRRYCLEHIESARHRVENAGKARDRAVNVLWAREVVNDPETVLVAMVSPARHVLAVRIEDMSGKILLDNLIDDVPDPHWRRSLSEPDLSKLPDWVFGPAALSLNGRRAIGTATDEASLYFLQLRSFIGRGTKSFNISGRKGDSLRYRHQVWAGKFDIQRVYEVNEDFRSPGLGRRVAEPSTIDILQKARASLSLMSSTTLTVAQEEYALQLHNDNDAIEYKSYFFQKYQRSVLSRRLAEAVDIFGS
ncbi:hypothetical protein [Lentzea sp. CA-135723]|uniref:hypothetical protein n=1 Tax=Lentzea sp. CA-135723 TaxID=3239950 RepID=UPI003D949F9B